MIIVFMSLLPIALLIQQFLNRGTSDNSRMEKNALIAPILHKKVGRYPELSVFVQGHTGQNHFHNPELVLPSTDSLGLSSQMWLCQHFSAGGMGRRARREKAREGAGTAGSTDCLIRPSLAFPSHLSPPRLASPPAFLPAPALSLLPHSVTGLGQRSSLGIPAQDPGRSQCLPPKPTLPAWLSLPALPRSHGDPTKRSLPSWAQPEHPRPCRGPPHGMLRNLTTGIKAFKKNFSLFENFGVLPSILGGLNGRKG